MILDLVQFQDYWNKQKPGLGNNESPLWIPHVDGIKWFVMVKPTGSWFNHDQYWHWCHSTLQGKVCCYSSSDEEEWWGFENKDDIVLWLLRWH